MEKIANPFYHTTAWRKLRKVILQRDHGMCVRCMERFMQGGIRPRHATTVHHIKHMDEYPDLALEPSNLQSLCDICHNQAHPEKGAKGYTDAQPAICQNVRIIKI